MSRIKTIAVRPLCDAKVKDCGECRSSCQSACKTSCTVGNQSCEHKNTNVKSPKKEQF